MRVRHPVSSVVVVALVFVAAVAMSAPPAHGGSRAPAASALGAAWAVEPDARRRPRLRVVPPGPASPTSPVTDSYYYLLQHGKCADLRVRAQGSNAEDILFASLADLCLAAKSTGYRADWAAGLVALDAGTTLDDCLSLAARRALSNALANHERTGRSRPDFRPTPKVSTCVPQQTQVALYQRSPDTSPSLMVLGLRLFEASEVSVNGSWHPATSRNAVEGTECARVDVPGWTPPTSGTTMVVTVRGPGYSTAPATVTLTPVVTDAELENLDTDACLISP